MASIQHLAMTCKDAIATERFYTKHMGFKRARVFNPGTPNEFAMIRLGGFCLELFPTNAETAAKGHTGTAIGFQHLAFEVDDIEKSIASLNADGIATDNIIDCSNVTPGMRIVFFRDPDGNSVELMEGWKDEANPPQLAQ